jgi:ABC-type antimicrobial peptide transport system permease subunit
VAESVRRTINSFDPHLPITSLKTADALIDETLDQEKLIAKLSSFFGVLALVLAAIGLYGVMSYITVRRTAEIGIRMALSAPRLGVIGMILRETLRLVMVGLAIGTLASVFATKLLSKSLFGLSGFDPITTVIAVSVITLAAVAASYLPAWRASRIDPTVALRYE